MNMIIDRSVTLAQLLETISSLRRVDDNSRGKVQNVLGDSSAVRRAPGVQPRYNQFVFTPRPIGFARTPYAETNQVPKGLGAQHDAEGRLEVLPEFQEGLADVDGFSHLYVLWEFDRVEGFDLIARPPADPGRVHGVFATRSPRRPNPIGLTVVELLRRDGPTLFVRGVDMLDGTPILDIKPYLSSVREDVLRRGWLTEAERRTGGQARTPER